MDIEEKVQILRACSSKKGERCSSCPAFLKGNRNCMRNAMKDAATALSALQIENQALRNAANGYKAAAQMQSNEMEGNMQRLKDGEHIFIVFGKDGKSVLDSQRRIRIYQSRENFEKFCPEPYNEVELVEYAPVQSHEEE